MFIAGLFIIAKKWKQSKCPSTDKWINKKCGIHIMEYYLAIKRNEVLTHATAWMYVFKYFKILFQGFPGGAVVENLPANAGDTGSSPGLGRSHMPWSN